MHNIWLMCDRISKSHESWDVSTIRKSLWLQGLPCLFCKDLSTSATEHLHRLSSKLRCVWTSAALLPTLHHASRSPSQQVLLPGKSCQPDMCCLDCMQA